jgi:DNA-binding GntR family transcriptional regulator
VSSLTPLTPRSLREEARLALRARIVTGEIAAGALHSVPSLAEKLGVSATPVREALLDLASEGLVEAVRNRGFRVITFDEHDLDEIFQLRLLLEAPSVRQVAGNLPPELERRLRGLVVELEKAAEDGDLARYLTADHQFHLGFLEPLGNERLVELVARLRDQQRLYGLPRLLHSAEFMATAAEHRAILDAAAAGDARAAENLMRKHLRHTRGIWAGIAEAEHGGKG